MPYGRLAKADCAAKTGFLSWPARVSGKLNFLGPLFEFCAPILRSIFPPMHLTRPLSLSLLPSRLRLLVPLLLSSAQRSTLGQKTPVTAPGIEFKVRSR